MDANNRQLHPTEYQIARDHARLVAKKLGITEEEAEGRIVRQLQRNVDGATAQEDGERRDEPIISILGCGLLKCDAKTTDPHYWDTAYNAEYIKPNQSSYDKGKAQSGSLLHDESGFMCGCGRCGSGDGGGGAGHGCARAAWNA